MRGRALVDDQRTAAQARLRAEVEADPGAAGFPVLVELYRRAGRHADAEAIARAGLARSPGAREARISLALVLLDLGREIEARVELELLAFDTVERHLTAPESLGDTGATGVPTTRERGPAEAGLSDTELEDAFSSAETDRDALIDPDRVAAEAVVFASPGPEYDQVPEAYQVGGPFATRSMADLLEQQGDPQGAERIRVALDPGRVLDADGPGDMDPGAHGMGDRRRRVVSELERWLANAQNRMGERA